MRSDRERLLDIREAIAKIDQHSAIKKDLPALKERCRQALSFISRKV